MTRSQDETTLPKVTLCAVDLDNYVRVMRLEVAPAQTDFLSLNGSRFPNEWALAESAYLPGFTPRAVCLAATIVGLVVWGPYHLDYDYHVPQEPGVWILDHVMIDAGQQGKGLGAAAVLAAIPEIFAIPECRRLVLSYANENERAGELYARLGFRPCGCDHEGAPMMELLRP